MYVCAHALLDSEWSTYALRMNAVFLRVPVRVKADLMHDRLCN